jgi:hypothetical protein
VLIGHGLFNREPDEQTSFAIFAQVLSDDAIDLDKCAIKILLLNLCIPVLVKK